MTVWGILCCEYKIKNEKGINQPIPDNSYIMARVVRWTIELLSKYPSGGDGKTPYQRIQQEPCQVPSVVFGELVVHLPKESISSSEGEHAREIDTWLGIIEKTGGDHHRNQG